MLNLFTLVLADNLASLAATDRYTCRPDTSFSNVKQFCCTLLNIIFYRSSMKVN